MQHIKRHSRTRHLVNGIMLQLVILIFTLGALEVFLRAANFRYLRSEIAGAEQSVLFQYDSEIGWMPIPDKTATFSRFRTITVKNNSLGLRDIEYDNAPKPTVLFVGDSYVWGYSVEADERFTEILRRRLPDYRIVNAGVSAFGTDQEYLLLRRLLPRFAPEVVVLVYCSGNDRTDNTSNILYDGYYKRYIVQTATGQWEWRQIPVPKTRRIYFAENWFARHSYIARVIVSAYIELKNPQVHVPDPTEHLIGMMRDLLAARNVRFLVGIQGHGDAGVDAGLAAYLRSQGIPFVTLGDAQDYLPNDFHWTPNGHAFVADRLLALLSQSGAVNVGK